jgi:hypothetical protein
MPASADVLSALQNPEAIDWNTYTGTKASNYTPPPIPVGKDGKRLTFEGVLPPQFVYSAKDGILQVLADPIVIKGLNYNIRFNNISAKRFQNSDGKDQSFLADFVKAVDKNARPATAQDYIRTIDGFARRTFKFRADWEAYDKESGKTVAKKYAEFPLDATVNDGFTRTPWVTLPDGRKVFANLKIKSYLAAA